MDMGGGSERLPERGGGAPRHAGPVTGPRDIDKAKDVGGGQVHGDVAGHRRDGLDAEAGSAPGEEQGEGVVDAGIGVDQDGTP
jgi:hypothetical protein